jgi:hypothetical protein
MSDSSTASVLPNKARKIMNDTAKVAIKSELTKNICQIDAFCFFFPIFAYSITQNHDKQTPYHPTTVYLHIGTVAAHRPRIGGETQLPPCDKP